MQHSFPLVYGIGPAGLPSTATALRRAQARQLKAYLMVYEQLLRNAYAQVAHAADLFSLNPTVEHTYFASLFDAGQVAGYNEIVAATLTEPALRRLVESPTGFLERRNRFLDHLLARFGESFGEYAMLVTDISGQGKAGEDLIRDKLAFLRAFPRVSHDRGRAFNQAVAPCSPDNVSGLQQRINLLLGFPDWTFAYGASKSTGTQGFRHQLNLGEPGTPIVSFAPPPAVAAALAGLLAEQGLDTSSVPWRIDSTGGRLVLTTGPAGQAVIELLPGQDGGGAAAGLSHELVAAQQTVLAALILPPRCGVVRSGNRWKVTVADGDGNRIGSSDQRFPSRQEGAGFIQLMSTWAAHKRAIVVEHLLLRPKFPGDALYPACTDGPGCGCGDEDPYSFRLTYVMPGWTAPFNTNLSMRGFADRTIQEQTPSHLLVKTCWVGNDGYLSDPCDPVIDEVASVLESFAMTHGAACGYAAEMYAAYGVAFEAWFAGHTLVRESPNVLSASLAALFNADIDLSGVSCAALVNDDVREAVQTVLVGHFVGIARRGYQFERFEDAWCAWADADAAIDWTREGLHGTVLEVLIPGVASPGESHDALCACATTILTGFGSHFRGWMDANIASGVPLAAFTVFDPPEPDPCAGLDVAPGAAQTIRALLMHRYARYTEVSYRLSILVDALGGLRNTYPRATLHDCGEGSDFNPVRFGQTALGSN